MMNFYIKKDSERPRLTMELINDGRNDYHRFFERIQNADITFSMTNDITGIKKISCRPCILEKKESNCDTTTPEEYYIVYPWRLIDTNKTGRFTGEFHITFLDDDTTLIVPIREELKINIID